ncbi:MAG: hypothetical protein B9S32_08285 [Verrucomicrobia bacterium Tous-C9LFEB]|nr:MAG: hypothetical protein B9S32_08285 [Verrucomicrobia bacterium Tous-C9LFEB]
MNRMKTALMGAFLWVTVGSPAWADYSTGFELSDSTSPNQYVAGSVINGKTDADTAANWTIPGGYAGGATISSTNPASGSWAGRLTDNNTSGAYGNVLNLGSTVSGFSSLSTWTFSIDLAFQNVTTSPTAPEYQLTLGQPTASGSGKYWFRFVYDDGNLVLYTRQSATAMTAVNLGSYLSYVSAEGEYVKLTLSIDPTLKKYTGVSLSGDLLTSDLTTLVQASNTGTIPWGDTTTGDPALNLLFVASTASAITVDMDNISMVPEPSSVALLGLACLTLLGLMRRRTSTLY